MCSICGIYGKRDYTPTLEKMIAAMDFRGPNGCFSYVDKGFYGTSNRLSINDLQCGTQPFSNVDGSIVVFFNGEIYNYKTLKEELQNDDIEFFSHCDGEILPFMYQKYGIEGFKLLDGMFGIALYDKNLRKIFLVRDIAGEKPLYYLHHQEIFAYSTLITPLREVIKPTLNHQAIWDFLTFGFIPEPQSIYQEIVSLPKGSILEFDCHDLTLKIKDFKEDCLKIHQVSYENPILATKELVSKSVYDRLLGDVKIGAFLSGGLDSSIVSALACKEIADFHTFSIAFCEGYDPHSAFVNESAFSQLVAKHIGSKHYELQINAKDFQKELESFIQSSDQPFGAISGIGIKLLARMARELGVKVLLSGDGADENFGGYAWYPKLRFNNPQAITPQKPKGWHYYAFEEEKKALFSEDFFANMQSSLRYFPTSDSLPLAFIAFDREFYLPYEMMAKLDRMCMSESVEGRACFLSPAILAFIQSLDYETLLLKGEKWLLKEAFRELLPQEILEREKHGFNAPIDYWMKKDWLWLLKESLSAKSALNRYGMLDKGASEFMLKLLFSSQVRVGNIAFYLVVLNLWLENLS
ncbi:asparagine synthase (glutamine-hydrolyzing) [Helicobacter apodemus]|uniref:asparagine synthase (glutamine-hydrolyzing) n=1 Tax=Helicobacter apodemus TaxID=135569 RepID=A0A2U8FBD2_9HELI|nr:asparagine synthase (glutamine-hydrolyzing) [Helicobacter apodemus]AWI33542.1 asparagine synthase (glutamine-hydrolyzing) [Helicobacter apodemus]